MDFEKFDISDSAERGTTMHVAHIHLGHLMYVGEGADDQGRLVDRHKPHEPVTMVVRGFQSESIQKLIRASEKKRITSGDRRGELTEADATKLGEDLMDLLVDSWSNIFMHGEPLDCNRANKVMLFEKYGQLWKQVENHAKSGANYMGKG